MKKIFLVLVSILAFMHLIAAGDGYDVHFAQPTTDTYVLNFELQDFDVADINISGTTYANILFDGSVTTSKKGFASLPFIHAALQLPARKNFDIVVTDSEFVEYDLDYPLVPSRGVIYRDQDPSSIPYEIDPKSIVDKWYPENLADQTDPYIIRDIRGTTVYVYPFQYNAAQNKLRVYSSVEIKLKQNNSTPVNPLEKEVTSVLYEMDAIYNSVFINYGSIRDDLTIDEVGDILVICTDRDEAAIEPYIQWKREKGYLVELEVVPVGTNVESLIQQKYDDNNDILYVQLVGDWADIKCNILSGYYPMDPQLGCVVGTDEFADISIGRISANDANHVTIQVDKVINYEKNPEMAGAWYDVSTGIASDEGPGDDGEYDYAHIDVIYNDKLDPFTYESHNDIYAPGVTGSMVSNAVNTGTSIMNYCGHGSATSWGTTGFNTSNVNSLTNADRLPGIFSVACNNGEFNKTGGDCFAEAWLKKENGGAVMFLGATISQPWDPPMRGQDYFMDVLIGGYDYSAHSGQSGINTTEQRTTVGSLIFNGLTLMCTEANQGQDWETAKTWTLFGDPSMQMRTDQPDELTLSNTTLISGIPFQTIISGSSGPVEGAMVALSQGDNYVRGFTDATGTVSIDQTFLPGTALLVVTAFNTETIYDTIDVVPANGAYIIYAYHEVDDIAGNGNGMIDYGESVQFNLALTNIGQEDASNVEVLVSSGDDYITFSDSTESYSSIPTGDTVMVNAAFAFDVANGIPDLHNIVFELESTGDETWTSNFGDMGHAPLLTLFDYTFNDPDGNNNGKLDAGETGTLTITIENAGTSGAMNINGELVPASNYTTLDESLLLFGNLESGESLSQDYIITADESTPEGFQADFTFNMTADLEQSFMDEFFMIVGQIPVLVIDMDGNNNSANEITTCLSNLGVTSDYATAVPDNLHLFASVFVCLGVYPDNYEMTGAEGELLAAYLNDGGALYLEGGDTWAYDDPTAVHPMFNINGINDGSADLGDLHGQDNSICESMDYTYSGDNNYMDQIGPLATGELFFENADPAYGCAVSNDAGDYKTIGMSFEFGGLDDADFTKDELMAIFLDFFGIESIITAIGNPEESMNLEVFGNYPNPFTGSTNISFQLTETTHVTIEVYNLAGQMIDRVISSELPAGRHIIKWGSENISGQGMPDGMYIYRVITPSDLETRKMVKMQ